MGFLENPIETVKQKFSDFTDDLGWGTVASEQAKTLQAAFKQAGGDDNNLWTINGQDWHKVFAYRFEIRNDSSTKTKQDANAQKFYYTLPIPPQNMVVKPIIPAKATPTVGGVVEEASQTTFWFISLGGTTGTGVSRSEDDETKRKEVAKEFRDRISTTGLLSGVAAGANQAIAKVGGIADVAYGGYEAFANASGFLDSASSLAGGLVGAANTAILPPLPYSGSAVNAPSNGFTEMQHFHKFLYIYQKLKDSNPKGWSLYFVDFKSDQRWRVIVKDFSIQRNSQNPHLYRYQIVLQGWNIEKSGDDARKSAVFDRFAEGGDLEPVNTVGLGQLGKSLKQVQQQLGPTLGLAI